MCSRNIIKCKILWTTTKEKPLDGGFVFQATASFVLLSAEHEGCDFSMSSLAAILVDVK